MSTGGSSRWCVAPRTGSARGIMELAHELEARGLGPVKVLPTVRAAFFDAPDSVLPWLEEAMLPDCHLERLSPPARESNVPKSGSRIRVGLRKSPPPGCKMGHG